MKEHFATFINTLNLTILTQTFVKQRNNFHKSCFNIEFIKNLKTILESDWSRSMTAYSQQWVSHNNVVDRTTQQTSVLFFRSEFHRELLMIDLNETLLGFSKREVKWRFARLNVPIYILTRGRLTTLRVMFLDVRSSTILSHTFRLFSCVKYSEFRGCSCNFHLSA